MGANTSYLALNIAKKPFDDIRVRQAIWYAVDIPQAIKIAYGNYGEVASGIISPGIDGRHPDLTPLFPKRDIEKAKRLLKEAGLENGFETEFSNESMNQQRRDFAEVIQAQLAEIGIRVRMNVMDVTQWVSTISAGEGYMTVYGYTASTGEAGRVLFRWMPDKTEFPIFSWTTQEYIDTISKALVTIDRDARNELYYKCQEMLMENYAALPTWHKELNAACSLQVRGFRITPSYEQHYLQYVYFVE
jgi:peptide/nickel transport system substrate-binding protein